MSKKILHIANDYAGSGVYKELVTSLANLGLQQTVYTAIRHEHLKGKNEITSPGVTIIYSKILNNYTRVNFYAKVHKMTRDIQASVSNLDSFDLIHAHTWYSDGVVAYKLWQKYQTPFAVTVRNTDINLFLKYMFHLRGLGQKVLENASTIFVISEAYKQRLLWHPSLKGISDSIREKVLVIPNGVAEYWHMNTYPKKQKASEPLQLLYAGSFGPGKNVLNLCKATASLNSKGLKTELALVGSGGAGLQEVLDYIKDQPFIIYKGRIDKKDELRAMYRSADIFCMPSLKETFGLVYIEALSQGLPILYTYQEGIYGSYEDYKVGEYVTDGAVEDIERCISKIASGYEYYSFDAVQILENHNWTSIANRYKEEYNKLSS